MSRIEGQVECVTKYGWLFCFFNIIWASSFCVVFSSGTAGTRHGPMGYYFKILIQALLVIGLLITPQRY